MTRHRKHELNAGINYSSRIRSTKQRNARLRLRFELLEPRYCLSADLGLGQPLQDVNNSRPAPITWFESFQNVERLPLTSLANVDAALEAGVVAPGAMSVGEWIVQLTDSATEALRTLDQANLLLNQGLESFEVINGLGSAGLILVHGSGGSKAAIEANLAENKNVASFSLNQLIQGQTTTPNDEVPIGLQKINATSAWDVTRGSLSTVVGVVDSGIDLTHPDLYLNIWINQGELPTNYLNPVGPHLTDIDRDGLITFYDLNNLKVTPAGIVVASTGVLATHDQLTTQTPYATGVNHSFVTDKVESNGLRNGRIDASDLLADANWADGRDTDNDGFPDDFFGVNFRSGGADPYAINNPSDAVGHGTHVAGTIGAIGNNSEGVVGVNWQTSLMSLRILDNNNQGDSGAAIRAVNYAREMRERYTKNELSRVTAGANVRVLNNSWGQPGGKEVSLETAIKDSGDTGILFVAAAGNGNILGEGVDNDLTPFFPASYDAPNVIAVAATDATDRPATFSNFGKTSVALFAPGVGIRSTLPGGGYGSANGTSMASPHVAGTAALIWSAFPDATVTEVRKAIVGIGSVDNGSVDNVPNGSDLVSSGGRLNAAKAINADVFAPAASLKPKAAITAAGGVSTAFTIVYSHSSGINVNTIGNDDIIVTRQWGPADELKAKLIPGSITQTTTTATATYSISAPGGSWDPLDFGSYVVSTVEGNVKSLKGNLPIGARDIGSFLVQVVDGNSFYVSAHEDGADKTPGDGVCATSEGICTLRAAMQEANARSISTTPVNIVLTSPTADYRITGTPIVVSTTVHMIGDSAESTVVAGDRTSQLFQVTSTGDLQIERVNVSGGLGNQYGGAFDTVGKLKITSSTLNHNSSNGRGGAITGRGNAVIQIEDSTLDGNTANLRGGAIALLDGASVSILRSTLSNNTADAGGAVFLNSTSTASTIENSTISGNLGSTNAYALLNVGASILLSHVTVVDNIGLAFGSVIEGPASVKNSIFADSLSFRSRELVGAISQGHNLVADNSLVLQSSDVLDPGARKQIGPLQDNGGPTKTHAIFSASSAVDASILDSSLTDQRGISRRIGVPDIGAFELASSHFLGAVFLDRNENGLQETNEEFLPGEVIFADANLNDHLDTKELFVSSNVDDPNTTAVNEAGEFDLEVPATGSYYIRTQPKTNWQQVIPRKQTIDKTVDGGLPNGFSRSPAISADGRYVVYASSASNLVNNDKNGHVSDVFLFDRQRNATVLISSNADGDGANGPSNEPSISADGRYIVYASSASNLVVGDVNESQEIFVFDNLLKTTTNVTNDFGIQPNSDCFSPTISQDGRYIAFASDASNLISGDLNRVSDIFVFDRQSRTLSNVSVNDAGMASNARNSAPNISADGRFVAFDSEASNLVPGDTNGTSDVFVYDRLIKTTRRISVNDAGVEGSDYSFNPYQSADGRYVTFLSFASNLFPGDNDGTLDAYLYDRLTLTVYRISLSSDGTEPNAGIEPVAVPLSNDGRFAVFATLATNVTEDAPKGGFFVLDQATRKVAFVAPFSADAKVSISGDGRFITFYNQGATASELVIVTNPLASGVASTSINFSRASVESNLKFGIVPNPGTINGKVFVDFVPNGAFDPGETPSSNVTVFLDLNGNGKLDSGEPSRITASDGTYQFVGIDSYRSYSVVIVKPVGFQQTVPDASEGFVWNRFLPAGGTISGRDFALRTVTSTGQSNDSAVSGRVFEDRNGNKVFDAGDVPQASREVFLDTSNFGVRDPDEVRVLTDAQGRYTIPGLSSNTVAVSTTLDKTLTSVSPVGSSFASQSYALFGNANSLSKPQAVASDDFDNDGFVDLIVASGDTNTLSIRLNDKHGGFLPDAIDIDLGNDGAGPLSLVVRNFDNNASPDVALIASLSNKVIVLLNFNPITRIFATQTSITVGAAPYDIVAGQFGGDAKLDLVVLNNFVPGTQDQTVQVLTNNGAGGFTAGPAISTGGLDSLSLVAGNFTGNDTFTDVAVVHALPSSTFTGPNVTSGGVRVLRGDGAGGLTLQPQDYPVGAAPRDAVVADFDGDHLMDDIAVANFGSNTISVLLGQADGTFIVQTETLGTANGALDITVGDVDNDGDTDLFAADLRDSKVSIFRNSGFSSGNVHFEPLENVGQASLGLGQRMPIVVGNFDKDSSALDGMGTIDIVAIPPRTTAIPTLNLTVLKNSLINGSRRAILTGENKIDNLDFIVTPAKLPPSFLPIVDPAPLVEDATLQMVQILGVTKGRTTGPALRFSATSSNTALIASPTITFISGSTQATLSYKPIANANGTSVITVRAVDAGADKLFGGSDDGIFERSFTVTVLAVNDPPTFTVPAQISVTQKQGAISIPNFATGITNGGGPDEIGQIATAFTVLADASYFTVKPAISKAGTLTFTPSPNQSGIVTVTVKQSDNGGIANGGSNAATRSFVINILPVNDAPSFKLGSSITVQTDAGPQTRTGFASGFSPGGGMDEATQGVSDYLVTVDTPSLFAVLPDISNLGVLTFTPARGIVGTTNVHVQVRDNGGTANGGTDLSASKIFTIRLTPIRDTRRPIPVLSTSVSATTNQKFFYVYVDFGEKVTGFTLADIVVSAGSKNSLVDLGSGKYRFKYAGVDGNITIAIPANIASDSADNLNVAATSLVVTLDSVGATPTISAVAGSLPGSFNLTITFNESVTGLTLDDFLLSNAKLKNLQGSGTTYTAILTRIVPGNLSIKLPGDRVSDAVGNRNLSSNILQLTSNL